MKDICSKCNSPRILLLTSYACDCDKAKTATRWKVGQKITTAQETNEALADGCTVCLAPAGTTRFQRWKVINGILCLQNHKGSWANSMAKKHHMDTQWVLHGWEFTIEKVP